MPVVDFTNKYKQDIARQFVDAWEENGPIFAGSLMRHILPETTLGDTEQLREFQPFIQAEFEKRGYTFEDEDMLDDEEEATY